MKAYQKSIIQLGYVAGLLLLLIIASVAYQDFNYLEEDSAWMNQATKVIRTSEKLRTLVRQAEIRHREYVLHSNRSYLSPYLNDLDSIYLYFRQLHRLIGKSALQKARLDSLKLVTITKIDLMQYAVLLKINNKTHSLERLLPSSQGQQAETTANIEGLLTTIIAEHHQTLGEKAESYKKSLRRMRNAVVGLLASFVGMILLALTTTRRQLQKEAMQEQRIHELQAELKQQQEEHQLRDQELIGNRAELTVIYEQLNKLKHEFANIVMARTAKIKRANHRLMAEVLKRKQIAEALRKSEARFRIALDNAPITVFNQDSSLRYTWIYANTASVIGNKVIVGKTDYDIFSPEDAASLTHIKQHVLNTRQGTMQEIQVTLEQKEISYLLSVEPLFNKRYELIGITCAAYDITQQKKAEDMLRKTLRELKHRNHELDNYVYKVSHDLRAPLVSILGLINLFKQEEDHQSLKEYILLIENRVNKLDDFIKSVLNHSRSLNSEILIQRINFEKVIAHCVDELRYLPNLEKMHVAIQVNQLVDFYSDELRITIIIKNLLSNAIKFLNPFMEQSYVRFTVDISEQQAQLLIKDNGTGIEAQYLDRIFDMFFRGTSRSDGSGLGLYIAKQSVELLEGSITVQSKAGSGTAFRITLKNYLAAQTVT